MGLNYKKYNVLNILKEKDMKKLISLLLAGATIVALSGCDESDICTPDSVQLSELLTGYVVSGVVVGESNYGSDMSRLVFCGGGEWSQDSRISWLHHEPSYSRFGTEDDVMRLDFGEEERIEIDTDEAGTPGKLEDGTVYDIYGDRNMEWRIIGIEYVGEDCARHFAP